MYAPSTQILIDIESASEKNWVKVNCKDGRKIEAYADCFTLDTIGDDEDVDALLMILRDGTYYTVAGVDIESFEILEER